VPVGGAQARRQVEPAHHPVQALVVSQSKSLMLVILKMLI
jgi:hypothetical protein